MLLEFSFGEWVLFLSGILFIIAVISSDADKKRSRRALGRYRTLINDAQEGELVTIVGRVRLGNETIKSSIFMKECCYYRHLIVGRNNFNGTETPDITVLVDESHSVDFYVEDGSGEAFIPLSRIQEFDLSITLTNIDVKGDHQELHRALRPETVRFLRERGIVPEYSTSFRKDIDIKKTVLDDSASYSHFISVKEFTLENGALVAVAGKGTWENVPSNQEPDSKKVPRRLVFREPPKIIVTNDPSIVKYINLTRPRTRQSKNAP